MFDGPAPGPSGTSPWGQPAEAASARRPGIVSLFFFVLAFALLVGLGVWQLQRLKWKEGLLARIAALQTAPARSLQDVLAAGGDLDFVRVSAACPDLERRPTLRLFAVWNGMPGYRLIAACPATAPGVSTILVDRGFIPTDQAAAAMQPGRAALPGPVVGVLRKGDKATFVTPPNRVEQNLWYSRDTAAMASALGAKAAAPVFLMIEQPAPAPSGPVPAPVPADIPNRHLEYAITWFGLAASLVGVYVAMFLRKRRT
jgi:surfeit locus 1 family protein